MGATPRRDDAMSEHTAVPLHLQMLQGVIARMASNSFAIKTLTVAFVTAFLAYMGARPHPQRNVLFGALIIIFVFWLLDASYLRLERMFRALYDSVRVKEQTDYSMNVAPFSDKVSPTWRIAFSWSVLWIYSVVAAVVIIVGMRS